jgi:HTH-type transcriptional regulator, quorum sensing regulator NprR
VLGRCRGIDTVNFGTKIRFERERQEITQSALAYGVCSISYLSKVENGKMEPSPEILALLCKKLNIDMERAGDSSKLVPRFKDDIDRLYSAIKHSDFEESHSIYEEINNKYETFTHPAFLLVKKLFDLRIAILNNKMS